MKEDKPAKQPQNKQSNFDVIRDYVTADKKEFELDDLQRRLLERWDYYIILRLGGNKKTGKIITMMMEKFGIERATAYNDMGNAEALYGYSATLDKRFRMGARIDYLEEKLKMLWDDEDPANRDYELAVHLESVLRKYYESYPELKQNRTVRNINYNFTKNEFYNGDVPPLDEAEAIINNYVSE